MDNIEPSEAAIISSAGPEDDTPREIIVTMKLRVINEQLLRRIAADRMTRSGYGGEIADHVDLPLENLAYEAIFASNPDPLSPVDMGFEVVSTGHD